MGCAAALPPSLSLEEKRELLMLVEEKARRKRVYRYRHIFAILYGWQREFIARTAEYNEVCLCAANQIGKTFTGTYLDAIHLMGDYPDDWPGYRFNHAPLVWCLGYSGEKCRDLLQKALFGDYVENAFTGGLVPPERIVGWKSMTGTPGAMREVTVRHASGEHAVCQFWSYSQGQHALMGDIVDWFHVDEEPKDPAIYPQVITRTANGGNLDANGEREGGRGILTFTPENGRTTLVIKFMDNPGLGQCFMRKAGTMRRTLAKASRPSCCRATPTTRRTCVPRASPCSATGAFLTWMTPW